MSKDLQTPTPYKKAQYAMALFVGISAVTVTIFALLQTTSFPILRWVGELGFPVAIVIAGLIYVIYYKNTLHGATRKRLIIFSVCVLVTLFWASEINMDATMKVKMLLAIALTPLASYFFLIFYKKPLLKDPPAKITLTNGDKAAEFTVCSVKNFWMALSRPGSITLNPRQLIATDKGLWVPRPFSVGLGWQSTWNYDPQMFVPYEEISFFCLKEFFGHDCLHFKKLSRVYMHFYNNPAMKDAFCVLLQKHGIAVRKASFFNR